MRTIGLVVAVLVVIGVGVGAQQQQQQYNLCAANEECVFWQHCYEGVVNTGGIGLIDVRSPIPIPANVTNPRPCQGVGKLCCRKPDQTGVDPGLQGADCPLHHTCVPQIQCSNGVIVTDGAGIIDVRIHSHACSNPSHQGVAAVCCRRPDPLPLLSCPADQTCTLVHECDASKGTGTYDASLSCYVDATAGIDGVCCEPPVVPECSRGYDCVTHQQCTDQGTVNTDGAGIINIRFLDRCVLNSGNNGVCCLLPAPDRPHVTKCPGNAACSPTGHCDLQSLVVIDGHTETCYRTEDSGTVGECCQNQPVLTCPATSTCNPRHLCQETPVALESKPACKLSDELVGVCCTKKSEPQIILDTCPDDSVCLPDILCQGEILTTDGVSYLSHLQDFSWRACRISSADLALPGVCCRNPDPQTNRPVADQCGVSSSEASPSLDVRIQSPKPEHAAFAEYPWMAIVFFRNQTFKCGAALVAENYVITAAHCVHEYTPYDLKIRLGEWQVDKFTEELQYEDYELESIQIHPEFNSRNLHNDIAVLKLSRPVTYKYHINRICLPYENSVVSDGFECVASGWGKDSFTGGKYQAILKKVLLPVVENSSCQDKLRTTKVGRRFILDNSFICAGGKEGRDTCTGDGGGPLMCKSGGRFVLYGLTAWGIGCGEGGIPGVYAGVPHLLNWVSSVMPLNVNDQLQILKEQTQTTG